MDIPESDWKLFKPLREAALERFYTRVIDEVVGAGTDTSRSPRDRYESIHATVSEGDREIPVICDTLRRSTALRQLYAMVVHGLVTEREIEQFSVETRSRLAMAFRDRTELERVDP